MTSADFKNTIVEIATFKLAKGVSHDQFVAIDHSFHIDHMLLQEGFISRETASNEDCEVVVIVHWRSLQDAETSMRGFVAAPTAKRFLKAMDESSLTMKRFYQQ